MEITTIDKISCPVVLTVGSFDGIHRGHKSLINELNRNAQKHGAKTVIITFEPHPRKVINPDFKLDLLTTLDEKSYILDNLNLDYLVIIKFDEKFRSLTPEEFYKSIILKYLDLKHVVIGFNHHFGKGRRGDAGFLKSLCCEYNFSISSVIPVEYMGQSISSSRIREALLVGNTKDANAMLGHPYTVIEVVQHGKKLGRNLGYPTINMRRMNHEKIMPGTGVYLTEINMNGTIWYGMTNVGTRPTFDETELLVETHIFDFKGDLYGKKMTVGFLKKLRDELKFSSKEELVEKMKGDEKDCRELIRRYEAGEEL